MYSKSILVPRSCQENILLCLLWLGFPLLTMVSFLWYHKHRRSWVIFRGGPTIPSCQNSILSCQHFFLSGGAKFFNSVLPSYRAKLLCQTVLPIGKSCKWMAEKQAKMKEKIAEINQKWQKTDKNDRKTGKMWSFTNYHLPSSHFCPAKLPFLSCQAPIFVLPS